MNKKVYIIMSVLFIVIVLLVVLIKNNESHAFTTENNNISLNGLTCSNASIIYYVKNDVTGNYEQVNNAPNEEYVVDENASHCDSNNCYMYFDKDITMWNFDYTGDVQTFTIPKAGTYMLEVWGAQGGQSYNNSEKKYLAGGTGGYSYGKINLVTNDKLYLYIGGQGNNAEKINNASVPGGFNGGGAGRNGNTVEYGYGGSGGGATDIRINSNSLYARVIVAGGGGASSPYYSVNYDGLYGAGGGEQGIKCMGSSDSTSVRYIGGTQTTGGTACWWNNRWGKSENGSFGQGGNAIITTYNNGNEYISSNAGGGGGWYGGGSGVLTGGNGGSGWIYTANTYNTWLSSTEGSSNNWLLSSNYYLNDAATINGNTQFLSPSGTNETGHYGNGYARITYLG